MRLARAIVSTGFCTDSVIASRTLETSTKDSKHMAFELQLGDGSARGVSACIVWLLLLANVDHIPRGETNVSHVVNSLFNLTAMFEEVGAGDGNSMLVTQAARQNQASPVQPANTFQWLSMARRFSGLCIGEGTVVNQQSEVTFMDVATAYNEHPEVEAASIETLPVSRRRQAASGKKADASAEDAERDQGLKIGRRRILAMKYFVSGSTEATWSLIESHIVVTGVYRTFTLTNDMLGNKWLYVGSPLPKEYVPSVAEATSRDVVSEAAGALIPDEAARKRMDYNTPLTREAHNLLFRKMALVFEAETAQMSNDDRKVRARPKMEEWAQARCIVQHWCATMEEVALSEMPQK